MDLLDLESDFGEFSLFLNNELISTYGREWKWTLNYVFQWKEDDVV